RSLHCIIQRTCIVFFFFSSRRRHTRSKRDWSSDVCSSDLLRRGGKHDDVGAAFLNRSVVFVENDIFRLKKNGGRAEKVFEIAKKARIHSVRLLTGCRRNILHELQRR